MRPLERSWATKAKAGAARARRGGFGNKQSAAENVEADHHFPHFAHEGRNYR